MGWVRENEAYILKMICLRNFDLYAYVGIVVGATGCTCIVSGENGMLLIFYPR